MKKLLLVIMVSFIIGCTNSNSATELLEKEGYTDIEMTGYSWFGCSEDDFYHTGFKAKKNGKEITGTVCEGFLFKGKTIRYE